MSCEALNDRLSGYLDRELDDVAAGEVEAHLRQCVSCTTRLERERRLRSAVQNHMRPLVAPASLQRGIRTMLRAEVRRGGWRQRWMPIVTGMAAALVGLVGGWQLGTRQTEGANGDLLVEVVASHVRSLQGAHLTDVASSEHHTVKPWFAGRLDFSPPVPDFIEQGYALAGGRLDYLGDTQVAALVYRRREHVINLFIWPSNRAPDAPLAAVSRRGYHAVHGTAGGMNYWAVSDLNATELGEFALLVRSELEGMGPRT